MSFCTAVNCIDGRVQLPVIHYLQEQFDVLYVDLITEPGPVRSLAGPADSATKQSIVRRAAISIETHDSRLVAVVAHVDCAGNPTSDQKQLRQLARSAEYLAESLPDVSVLGLWVDDRGAVSKVCTLGPITGTNGSD